MTTHLIAVDEESGTLWGGVEAAEGRAGLRAEVVAKVGVLGIMEPDEDGEPEKVTGAEIWRRCVVYLVALSDDQEEAPGDAAPGAELVYSGTSRGWLPTEKLAAWGHRA